MNGTTLRRTTFQAARMARRYPARPGLIAAALLALAGLAQLIGWSSGALLFAELGGPLLVLVTGWWWFRHVARPHDAKALIRRRAEQDQHSGGVASRLDIAEHASAKALRVKAHVLRPTTYRGVSFLGRRRIPVADLGVEVARLGWGWWGERIHSTCEDATMRIGGPRTGKTLSLAAHGLDAPGALITTSTRLDLAENVHAVRSARGRVHVFNPAGLGGLESTVRWRVLSGCTDFATAARRSADLIPESEGEAERWDDQARRILALLLHAAAVSDRNMRDVLRWVTEPAAPATVAEVTDALVAVPLGGRERATTARGFFGINDRTRSSVTAAIARPLAWISDDRARQLGDAAEDDPLNINLSDLIQRGETLHLIGHEDQTSLSALIGALVAEIAHAARTLAANQPSGRLDPPVTMLLDEAALVCPVPLDRWTADMGGRGLTLHISVQSLSQLRQRWGDDGAGTILANVACFIVFGGSASAQDLRDLSLLTGEHRMKVVGADHDQDDDRDGEQRGEYRWVPVMSPAQIRALEPGQVLVMRRNLPTAVGWAPLITARRGWAPVPLNEAVLTAGVPTAAELEALLEDDTAAPARGPLRARLAGLWHRVAALGPAAATGAVLPGETAGGGAR